MTPEIHRPGPPGITGLYRALWRFAAGKRPLIFASSALLVLSQVAKLAVPWLAGQAINAVQLSGTENLARAGWLMLAIFLVSIASWAMHGPGRIIERSVALRVRENLSDGLYARLAALPLAWHETHHSGETLHRVDRTTHALSDFAESQFIYLQNAVNLAGPIIALVLLSRVTGLAALAGYAVIGFVILRFDTVMMRLAERENQAERRYASALVDCLGNVSTILALRLQRATRRLLAGRLAAIFEPLRRSILVNEGKWCAVDLLNIALWCSLVVLYAWLAQQGGETLLLGNVFMVYQYTQQAGGVISSLAGNYQQFARFQADYQSADPIWAARPRPAPEAAPAAGWQQIDVQGVSFAHARARGEGPSLAEVSLTLRRGERIALVGPSGGGKSTLLRVLAGLYDPEQGGFVVDGAGCASIAATATLIPQDAEVFEGSVRDNITFGEEVDDAVLRASMAVASFEPVVATLPEGLDTVISERGLNLSGGQKQRLALARGLVAARDSALILLDEPTASLDPVIEGRVYAALDAAFPDACIVSSIHRLHLLPRFDRVVLMAEGRVLDQGTVASLRERSAMFRELLERGTENAAGDA
jgi:ABC-type multidrug transport system fused ATPase/permease subunit